MSTAVNPSQGTPNRQGQIRSIFSKDDRALAEKQSTTFDQLLAGFDWKPIEAPEESIEEVDSEEVAEIDSNSKPEAAEKKEDDSAESTEAEVVATEEVLLQTEVVATLQTAQKTEAPTEQTALIKDSQEGEKVVEAVEAKGIEDLGPQKVVVKGDDKPVEVKQEVDQDKVQEVTQVDSRVHDHRDRRRKDEVVSKSDAAAKSGPVVAQAHQQTKVEAKKEVKVEQQEAVQGAPTQNLDEARTNRRSRKERLAENAENPRGEVRQQGFPDEISDSQNGAKPDVSVKPPEQPLEVQPLENNAATPQIATAPPPQATVAPTTGAEVRVSDRSQAVGGVQNNNSAQRTEGRSESANRTEDAQKSKDAKKAEEKSAIDQRTQIRLIQRVARGFERIGEQGGNIRLRLHPPELGSLAMTVRVEGKSLSAEIVTETVQARQALVENLPQLKQQLADNGLTIEKFDVRVMDQQAGFSGQTFSGQSSGQNSSQSSSSWNQPSQRRAEATRTAGRAVSADTLGNSAFSAGVGANRSLDVRV